MRFHRRVRRQAAKLLKSSIPRLEEDPSEGTDGDRYFSLERRMSVSRESSSSSGAREVYPRLARADRDVHVVQRTPGTRMTDECPETTNWPKRIASVI